MWNHLPYYHRSDRSFESYFLQSMQNNAFKTPSGKNISIKIVWGLSKITYLQPHLYRRCNRPAVCRALEVRLRNAWVLYKITHLQNLFLRIQFKFETYVKSDTSKRDTVFALNGCAFETNFRTPLRTRWFEIYVKLSTSNRIWNICSIRVWALCQTSFSGYPVPLRAFELLNLVNSQPFLLI